MEREPQPSPLYNSTLEQLREYIKERQATDVAATAAAQVEEEDTEEDNKEVLIIIERTGSKSRANNEDERDNKDISKTIKAFKE